RSAPCGRLPAGTRADVGAGPLPSGSQRGPAVRTQDPVSFTGASAPLPRGSIVNVLPSAQVRSPARLLVVTDRQALAQLVILTLNHGVYVARIATTGAEATALLERWRAQLVVLDMDVAG